MGLGTARPLMTFEPVRSGVSWVTRQDTGFVAWGTAKAT